jgi:hypothetical protein
MCILRGVEAEVCADGEGVDEAEERMGRRRRSGGYDQGEEEEDDGGGGD